MPIVRQALLTPATIPTLKRGLALQGYYVGEVGAEVTRDLLHSICRFQYNQQIYPSGIFCPLTVLAYNKELAHAQEFSQRTDALAYRIPWDPKTVRRSRHVLRGVRRTAQSPREMTRAESPRSVRLREDAADAFDKFQAWCHSHGFVLPLASSASYIPPRRLLPSSGLPYYSLRCAGLSWSWDVHAMWSNPRKDPLVVTEDRLVPGNYQVWGRGGKNLPTRVIRAVWLERWVTTSGIAYPLLVQGDVEGPFINLTQELERLGFASPPPVPYYGCGSVLPVYGGLHEVIYKKGLPSTTVGDALLNVHALEEASQHPHWDIVENLPLPWVLPWAYTFL